jgi:predicted DsbA family dithiol-disulfide isomerase
MSKKIKIEVWSDVMCPFCYIGKRRLEQALEKFPKKDEVEIEWKSFQLDPNTKSVPGKDAYTYLAERYGRDIEWSKAMHENVTNMAAEVGLDYRFDKAQIANSFDAHRLEHLAKKLGKGNKAVELIFAAYFTEGKDIADIDTLIEIGKAAGIDQQEIEKVFKGSDFGNAVRQDIAEAQQLGITGVPFFVFNRKYGISGAQPVEEFSRTLEQVMGEVAAKS